MKNLEKLRKEWDSRPLVGTEPSKIEKKFPKPEKFWADPQICIIESCLREVFRGQPRCREHHLKWVSERKAESEKRAEAYFSRRSRKGYPEIEAQNMVRRQPHCANCGNYVPSLADRVVQLKPKSRLPKAPTSLTLRYEMLCKHCAGK